MQQGNKIQSKSKSINFSFVIFFGYFFGILFILVTLAPLFEHLGLSFISQPIYFIGGFLCHQMYTRSLHLFDLQSAVCTRDQLMYLAMSLAAFFTYKHKLTKIPVWLLLLLILPEIIDGSLQLISSFGWVSGLTYSSTNFLRGLTGALFGTGLGYFLFPVLLETEAEVLA
jgi:uncharacterized membrane protein